MHSFLNLEPVHCFIPSASCCFLTCIQGSQEVGKLVWHFHLFKNFPQFVVIHTVKGFSIVNKAEVDVFLELPCFFYDPVDVGDLISDSSAFLNPAWTFGISWFTYYWSLAWRILSITLLVCEMSAVYSSLSILWHCPSLRSGLHGGSEVKASAWKAEDPGSILGSEKIPWRRQWQPAPVLLCRESHGGRSLVGYSPWGCKESDMTERLHYTTTLLCEFKVLKGLFSW